MGCTQSQVEAEEPVGRCRDRKRWLRAAVVARHALASAHSAHALSLKNVGAALSDYASGEAHDTLLRPASTSSAAAAAAAAIHHPSLPPMDTVLPPPPPLPSDISSAPLARSISAPDLPIPKNPKKKILGDSAILEEKYDADDEDGEEENAPPPPTPPQPVAPPPMPTPEAKGMVAAAWNDYFFPPQDAVPPPTLDPHHAEPSWAAERRELEADRNEPPPAAKEPPKPVEQPPAAQKPARKARRSAGSDGASTSASAVEAKKGGLVMVPQTQEPSLVQILNRLDDHFLKASESAHSVSKMLEATRMHYHSNFADSRGYIDHSARVMQVITWNRSFKGIPQPENAKNDIDDDERETLATILDKILAWEKKMYEEVKASELMKMEYQQKLAVLNKKKRRGASAESVEKTKAVVSHLHTKYIVDMQSMESTISEINRLRDHQLYPKLVELVSGLEKMWESMFRHHSAQLKIITELKSFDISVAMKETSEDHHERTAQLWTIVRDWHLHLENLMKHKREYVEALYSWLKLNLIPIEINLKEKDSSPTRETAPPIKRLLHDWRDHLGKVHYEVAKNAIYAFSEVISTIMVHQEDELKLRMLCEDLRKELERKRRHFEDWYRKYMERRAGISDDSNPEGLNPDPVAERKVVVETFEVRLKEEEDSYRRLCKQVREKSLASLRTHLPELFRAMLEFSLSSSLMYKDLCSVCQSNNQQED